MKRLLAVVSVIASIAGVYGVRAFRAPRAAPLASPRLAAVELRTIASTVEATGIVRLRVGAEVRVGSQVSGILKTLNVTVGSHIRAGEVIAEIDSRALDARLAQAHAEVAVAEQEARRASVELERARRLDDGALIPRQQLDDASLTLDDANAKLAKAQRDADVVATDVSYAVIRAPITGTVASVSTQEGETVAASFTAPTFVTIIGDHALQLVAMVDETDIGAVAGGNRVAFTVEAFPDREFDGHVERIAPKATVVSGVVNYEVLIAIESRADALKPDMTANISIRTAERQALLVPDAAIRRDGDARFVLVDRGGSLERRPVVVGTRDAGATEVKKGVAAGDRVALRSTPDGSNPEKTR